MFLAFISSISFVSPSHALLVHLCIKHMCTKRVLCARLCFRSKDFSYEYIRKGYSFYTLEVWFHDESDR